MRVLGGDALVVEEWGICEVFGMGSLGGLSHMRENKKYENYSPTVRDSKIVYQTERKRKFLKNPEILRVVS